MNGRQNLVLPGYRGPDFAQPSEPREWFYNAQALRSDSFGFLCNTTACGTVGATYSSAPASPPLMQWKTNRLLLGIYAAVELSVSAVPADAVITAAAFIGSGQSSVIDLVGPATLTNDGGTPNILCGVFCSLNLPSGNAGTKSKVFGVGFGRTPLYIPAGLPVRWFNLYVVPTAPATGTFVGNATFYTVPAG